MEIEIYSEKPSPGSLTKWLQWLWLHQIEPRNQELLPSLLYMQGPKHLYRLPLFSQLISRELGWKGSRAI